MASLDFSLNVSFYIQKASTSMNWIYANLMRYALNMFHFLFYVELYNVNVNWKNFSLYFKATANTFECNTILFKWTKFNSKAKWMIQRAIETKLFQWMKIPSLQPILNTKSPEKKIGIVDDSPNYRKWKKPKKRNSSSIRGSLTNYCSLAVLLSKRKCFCLLHLLWIIDSMDVHYLAK